MDPIVFSIGFFALRWYAFMYILGFFLIWLLLRWRIKRGEGLCMTNFKSNLEGFLLAVYASGLVGGRLGYVLFYDLNFFWQNPWRIISPLAPDGSLQGISGMSFYGAVLGALGGGYFFAKKKKISFWTMTDFVVPAFGLGYFWGRVGNFLNGELWGRVTDKAWGMHFVQGGPSLRHPSQLYEALGEGLLLFWIFWPRRNTKMKKGLRSLLFLESYAIVRFMLEFWRAPDAQDALVLNFFSKGQILSLLLFLAGLVGIFILRKK